MMQAGRTDRFRSCAGHVALYTLLLFPVVFSLGAVAIDVSGWNSYRDKLQQEADRIAFQAASALPDLERARQYANTAGEPLATLGAVIEVAFPGSTPSSISVTLQGRYRTRFDFLLDTSSADTFTARRTAVAQLVPTDTVLVVSDGAALRPRRTVDPSGAQRFESWGNPVHWPASPYFSCVRAPVLAEQNSLHWDWWRDWRRDDFQRWATQSCFNPILSPLKLAAIHLAESTLSPGTNRLAIVFTPGEQSQRGFRVGRHIHGASESPELYANMVGGFPHGSGAGAHWGGYLELQRFLGDEICMLLSNPAASLSFAYDLPGAASGSDSCGGAVHQPACGGIHSSEGHLSTCYAQNGLSVRDAIYWNAAKLPIPGFPAEPDLVSALRQAWNELLDAKSEGVTAAEVAVRGNLAHNAKRRVIALIDQLPDLVGDTPALTNILESFHSQNIDLTIIAFAHPGLDPGARALLESRAAEIGAFRAGAPSRAAAEVLVVHDPEELRDIVAPRIAVSKRQIALRS